MRHESLLGFHVYHHDRGSPIRKLQFLQDSFAMPFPKREAPRRPSLDSWSENGGMLSRLIFIASWWMTSCQSVGELWNCPPFQKMGTSQPTCCFEEIRQGMFLFPWHCSKLVPNWNSSSRCITCLASITCWWPNSSATPSKLPNLSDHFSNHSKSPSFLVNTVNILDFLWVC